MKIRLFIKTSQGLEFRENFGRLVELSIRKTWRRKTGEKCRKREGIFKVSFKSAEKNTYQLVNVFTCSFCSSSHLNIFKHFDRITNKEDLQINKHSRISNTAHKQTDKQMDRQTNRQTNKQTNKQTNRQTNRQTNKQTNRWTN